MKLCKFFSCAAVVITMLMLSALAITVDYDLGKGSIDGTYKITATVKDDTAEKYFAGFKNIVTFDNNVIIPVSAKSGSAANIAGGTVKTPLVLPSFYDEDNEEDVSVVYTSSSPSWVLNGNMVTLDYEIYTTNFTSFDVSKLVAFEMYFKFADGKSAADITKDSFKIDYIAYGNRTQHYFGKEDAALNDLVVTNNVVPSTTSKITVPAGSSVVFQDYIQAAYEAETEVDVDITTDGFVVVNTGYTAQTVYQVANGSIAKVGNFEDGLLGYANTDIRADSKYQGIRFHSFITDIARTEADDNKIVEYGYVVTAESKKNALSANYELNMSMVDAGKAFKGVAFDAKTNIVFKKNDDNTEFTGLVVGIPMTKDGLNTVIAARPYYKTQSGKYVYGKMTRKTVAETAKAIKAEGGETYNNNKDYIDKILSTVAEDFTEISIDVSELYAE